MKAVPVGLSRDLAEKHVMRADVHGQDVAVWRDPDGDLHAWNNRCPHRGMRLSHGFVRGGTLACLYHGWHYAKDGRCAYIPAHPDLEPPATIRAETYHITEKDGVMWVDTKAPADAPGCGDALIPLRSLALSCDEKAALAAFAATPHGADLPVATKAGTLRLGPRQIALCAAPLGADATMVHVRVDRGAEARDLKALSRWCEAARRTAEVSPT